MNIKEILFTIRALGLGVTSRTTRYALIRDGIEKRYLIESTSEEYVSPGGIIHIEPIPAGIKVEFEHAKAEILFLTPNIVRISWEPGRAPLPYALAKSNWPAVKTTLDNCASNNELSAGSLKVVIGNDGGISFRSKSNTILHNDYPPSRNGNNWKLISDLQPDEHIYGLGERAASLNLRPGRYRIWNTDPGGSYSTGKDPLYICSPVYIGLSNTGTYLVFHENSYPSTFNFGENAEAIFEGGMLRYYFVEGSLNELLERYTELVGRAELPPRWVLGYHQCRWGYHSEDEIRKVIKGFKEHDLPISAIHLDIDYMDGFRVFTIDKKRFPNMKKLVSDLEAENIKVVSILDVGVKQDPNFPVYQDGIKKDIFCKCPNGKILIGLVWPGWSVYPDFTDPKARQWWGEKYSSLVEAGISGFWHDMNEPTAFAAWGEKTIPRPTLHVMEGYGGDHIEAHNVYGLLMNRAGYEALRNYSPKNRPWILSRSGWAGLQRYAWNWTGDTETSWQSLRQTIPTILGLGLSGHTFSGPDIGGFSGSPSVELYLRWFQMASFLPFFRTHSAIGTARREPWVYGEPTTDIIRKYLKLRYRLLPYLYTLAWDASQNGIPPVRPLFWGNSQDQTLWDISNAFLLGDALLIAPILEEGSHSRDVILPAGNWYSFWDDQMVAGSSHFQAEASDEKIPIFVKSGSIIPMEDNNCLQLHIYPQLNSELTSHSHIYFDAGDGYGDWRIDSYELTRRQTDLIISWEMVGDFPFPYQEVSVHIHGFKVTEAWVDGTKTQPQVNNFKTQIFQNLRFQIE